MTQKEHTMVIKFRPDEEIYPHLLKVRIDDQIAKGAMGKTSYGPWLKNDLITPWIKLRTDLRDKHSVPHVSLSQIHDFLKEPEILTKLFEHIEASEATPVTSA